MCGKIAIAEHHSACSQVLSRRPLPRCVEVISRAESVRRQDGLGTARECAPPQHPAIRCRCPAAILARFTPVVAAGVAVVTSKITADLGAANSAAVLVRGEIAVASADRVTTSSPGLRVGLASSDCSARLAIVPLVHARLTAVAARPHVVFAFWSLNRSGLSVVFIFRQREASLDSRRWTRDRHS